MGLLDKVKAGAEQAASRAKEEMQEVQIKRELSQSYQELGKRAFELAEAGELRHPELEELVAKARGLKTQLDEAPLATATSADPPADGPPAMPV